MRLLIVDDNAAVRELLSMSMAGLATEIIECSSGEEAVELCDAIKPDAITMDLRMKKMDGLAAAALIRHRHPHVLIAIVTEFFHPGIRTRAERAGVNAFLSKDDLAAARRYFEDALDIRASGERAEHTTKKEQE